ncbi:tRNA pseudouridine(38-40) synthase [Halanaerobium saccharolyticum]|uniref:tRNA pseudouridine synthase A n=1 Tax=Halanaerobium saccharolyticum TaxID=43595 RepID=A0A4R7YZ97_9FIRM|nr:tRNA pseudouridine(38-40) synthase TruA [Halanaerobium saccharolyticum]RAK07749.1 tRNA pseudouridine(38-40) synthase [Halanaerobium saccharolyticum]TDW03642.1 tRNA pseudouridine(38-40) synthase [Halanaerobium saccharolyticum]TDX59481.1 tRNA pseudouridine(38-40) synthase [Halanaerobium saccharolyticum]
MRQNYKIIVEYDGTNYSGWQIQKNTSQTIQQKIEQTLTKINKNRVQITGAGRTDAGVHAAGQTANFFLDVEIPLAKIPIALNTELPDDIICKKAEKVDQDFHARYDARGKKYRYRILNSNFNSVFVRNFVYNVYKKLDLELMQKATNIFEGCHDFASFCAAGSSVESTVREIYSLDIYPAEDAEIWIDVVGNGFLYNMIRILAGTLIEAGLGKRTLSELKYILQSCDRNNAGFTAPAQGLTLIKVLYD